MTPLKKRTRIINRKNDLLGEALLMVEIFKGCIKSRFLPRPFSPCYKKIIEILKKGTK